MNKNQTSVDNKPRKLGRGISALLGEPVSVRVPPVPSVGPSGAVVETKPVPSPAQQVEPTPQSPTASTSASPSDRRVVMVPCEAIEPSRFQPRKTFDPKQIEELSASIRSAGVVQPVLVRPLGSGRYELIAGERRWRASKQAGLSSVPAVVSDLSDEQAAEWSLIENVQRADLSVMERAWAVRGLCERFGLSHAQVAEKLGIDRSSATNLIRLTDLEPEVRDLLESQQLSGGHGKALLSIPAGEARIGLAKQAASQGWSVRRLEQAASRAAEAPAGAAPGVVMTDAAVAKAAALRDLEKQLGEHLGTSVKIRANASGKRGSLVIRFYGLDHFDGLMSKIGFVLK